MIVHETAFGRQTTGRRFFVVDNKVVFGSDAWGTVTLWPCDGGLLLGGTLTPYATAQLSQAFAAFGSANAYEVHIPICRPVRATVQERRRKVRELYARGLTALQMAERLGVSERTIRRDSRALGLRLR